MAKQNRWLAVWLGAALAAAPAWASAEELQDDAAETGDGSGAAESDVTNPEDPSTKSSGGINPSAADGGTGSADAEVDTDADAGAAASSGTGADLDAGSSGTSGVESPNVEGPDDPSAKSPGTINPSE